MTAVIEQRDAALYQVSLYKCVNTQYQIPSFFFFCLNLSLGNKIIANFPLLKISKTALVVNRWLTSNCFFKVGVPIEMMSIHFRGKVVYCLHLITRWPLKKKKRSFQYYCPIHKNIKGFVLQYAVVVVPLGDWDSRICKGL